MSPDLLAVRKNSMNSETLRAALIKYRYLIFVIIVAIFSWIAIDVVIKEKLEDLESTIKLQVSEQESLLATIAETTARNGADEVTESVVKDCSVNERTEFDTLLGKLDRGLSNADLTKLERLYGRCGSFFAERKAVMVSRLEREFEVYEAYLTQLGTISDKNTLESYKLEDWRALVAEEKKQSELFTTLVGDQDRIIKTLLGGKTTDSPEIKEILTDVKATQELLLLANRQAADLRTELVPL